MNPAHAHSCVNSVLQLFLRPNSSLNSVFPAPNAAALLTAASAALAKDPAVLSLSGSFAIVGDLHGSLDSLLRVFSGLGWPPTRKFIFLGDYVDRGENSTEVIFVLYALKILFPEAVWLLRGNHECRSLTGLYGFKAEIVKGYSEEIYDLVVNSFDLLPIAAVVNDGVFCVHGGLSPALKKREDLNAIVKPKEDPVGGTEGDLMWSDFDNCVVGWEENVKRGCGFVFGLEGTEAFLKGCEFSLIVRSHQDVDGSDWPFGEEVGCLTVFTAADYMENVNDGVVLLLDEANSHKFHVFPPLLDSMKRQLRLTWPEWLLRNGEGVKGIRPPAGLVRRTMSQPIADDNRHDGVEISVTKWT
jgi:diadenosine tetraphosphatase ApaH/serine/threonine PP2A family protein phosphatase